MRHRRPGAPVKFAAIGPRASPDGQRRAAFVSPRPRVCRLNQASARDGLALCPVGFSEGIAMRRRLISVLASLGVVLFAAMDACGQTTVGTAFTYQGQLKDEGGSMSCLADMRFTLYDAPMGGFQIGPMLTALNLPVVDGRFVVQLDFGPNVFDGQARYLQIDVRRPAGAGGYTNLLPRQPIMATPYALYSLNGGPQGPQGPQGPAGPAGPQGPAG